MLRDDEVEEVLSWIEDHLADRLSDWEANFVDDVRRRWDEAGTLPPGTRAKLEQIFADRRDR